MSLMPLRRFLTPRRIVYSQINKRYSTSDPIPITLIPGDGVGNELISSVKDLVKALGTPVKFEELILSEVSPHLSVSIATVVESINKNKVAIKGTTTSSLRFKKDELITSNMLLRKSLDLYANVVKAKTMPGLRNSRYKDVDIIVVREQTEGEYSCLEHQAVPNVVESLKVITEKQSLRIARFAFDYALKNDRRKVTAVHKANIMKLSDGLFLKCCEVVSNEFPSIRFDSMIVDNCCMQIVSNPRQFDVLVMPNLYGAVIDNLVAGLVGGAGFVPGENHSDNVAVYEPGARHSFLIGAGRNIANPTALFLCTANMLNRVGLEKYSLAISEGVRSVINDRIACTQDAGGYATTTEFTEAVISATLRAFNTD